MSGLFTGTLLRWAAPVVALGIGLLVGGQGRRASPFATADAAGALSPLDRLLIEDDIRQRLVLYGLYADGDGVKPRDTESLASQLMSPDTVSEIYHVYGGPVITMSGRGPIAASRDPFDPTLATRHFLIATYFDEVSATTVKTRTPALHLRVTKNMIGADCEKAGDDACGGRVVKATTWVYHMTWTKTADGWQISRNVLRHDNT